MLLLQPLIQYYANVGARSARLFSDVEQKGGVLGMEPTCEPDGS